MSDNVTSFPSLAPQPDLLIGPFEEWRVVVDGRIIPHLTGFRNGDEFWLTVDHRLTAGPFTEEGARQAAWLAGNAMAVASGYPWLGATSKDRPFASQGMAIDSLPDK
jgi:hypothetical protein